MKNIFINENIEIFEGDKARKLLKKKNDTQFISEGHGIIKVTKERWAKAQNTERKHWMIKGLRNYDDRNYYHALQFNNYFDLKDKTFTNVLEIGCGPYTNLRIIGNFCKINSCTLVDPLINDYLKHPFCSYSRDYLYIDDMSFISKIVRRISLSLNQNLTKLSSRKIRVKSILSLPAEELDIDQKFDLIIMINVLEHCFDTDKIFKNILKITSKDAYLIFGGDKLYEHKSVVEETNNLYDAAHPLRVDRTVTEDFLKNNFETVYKRIQTKSSTLKDVKFIWDDIYFIGKRVYK